MNKREYTQANNNGWLTNKALGLINGIISGISFGLIPLFSIPVIAAGMGNVSILVYRFLFGSMAMLVMLLLRKTDLRITFSEFWRIAILSAFYIGTALATLECYHYLSSGIATALVYTDPIWCAVIGLAFLGGSYMAESILSGLKSVKKIQIESAESLGMKRGQVMRYIVIPQATTVSVPSICANVIFLLKETSVFSAVSLADLMYVAKDLIGMYYSTTEALVMLVVAYLIIILPISILFSVLERRLKRARN